MRNLIVLIGLGFTTSGMGKEVMLMNRIGPSKSELYVANPDASGERKLLPDSGFDYHASYSYDGKWIVFTSERSGYGQADIYRVHPEGTAIERLTDDPALDDQAVLSPDDTQLAFVSTRGTYRANIWILDLKTKQLRNLTGQPGIQGDPMKPDAFLRPSWSPDGQWIAFSSDRNTEWTDHGNHTGWEHLQELSIYIVHPDGTGFRRITGPGICSGSPKWSADSKQVVFYEMPVETTWDARIFFLSAHATSQIISVDLATGKRTEQTSGPGLKLMSQLLPNGRIGFLTKAGKDEGVGYSSGQGTSPNSLGANEGVAYTSGELKFPGSLRSPAWSLDGKQVVYEKVDYTPRPQNQLLYSWDPQYEYRYTDVFPSFSKDGTLLITNKDGDSSVVTMNADGSNKKLVYKAVDGSAFAPSWSPDGQWIVFGFGSFLQGRRTGGAKIMIVRRNGTELHELTSGMPNAGFPSWSGDGTEIVYRSWGPDSMGLRIMNVNSRKTRVLTNAQDNLPYWSPEGSRIVFTRGRDRNFDIYTIKPDGTDLRRLTTFPANDAHAVWTADSEHIMWNSGEYGFKDEAALYDHSFQPYGSIWIMNADGTGKRQLTDSHWEDAMPCFVPSHRDQQVANLKPVE